MGSPNVGKSTLMNELIGMKIAIVTNKAQTTRNKVVGILTRDDYQMVFLDTPGLHKPNNRLGEYMVKTAYEAQKDVDVTLMVLDAKVGIKERDEETIKRFLSENFLVAINKTDVSDEKRINEIKEKLLYLGVKDNMIMPISAKEHIGLDKLESRLLDFMIPGPQFYPEDMVTDRPERFIAAEIIREKVLVNLREEVPHGVGVDIEKVEEYEDLTNVDAVIYCDRDSHKGIIIGKKGAMLKKIGSEARTDLERLFGTKVFLQLWVKGEKRLEKQRQNAKGAWLR